MPKKSRIWNQVYRLLLIFVLAFFTLFIIFGCTPLFQPKHSSPSVQYQTRAVIPKPVSIDWQEGVFFMNALTEIYSAPELISTAQMMSRYFQRATGYPFPVKPMENLDEGNAILLILDNQLDILMNEGYHLMVTPDQIVISARHEQGIYYAFQTLRQLLPHAIENSETYSGLWSVPCAEILDYHSFTWRGYMLDSARHFQTLDEIKRIIDLLALHKINRFHWHLIDDQGWRIGIPQYPELTKISAFRPNANAFLNYREADPSENYGGYYTHEEIHELVAYARQRNITIIPEIEMPGHTLAVLMAYPELSCRGTLPVEVGETWIYKDVYCAGNENTFKFLQNVLDVVLDLFPSPWIHVGGDEVPKDRWQECHQCQSRIEKEGLQDEKELQSYFMKRIESYLHEHNRELIGWDDIMEGGLSDSAIVQTYREPEYGVEAANQGNQVIFSTHLYVYFDYNHEGTPVEKTYSFDPLSHVSDHNTAQNIIGIEACQWLGNVSRRYLENTGQVMPAKMIEHYTFPRLLALSEIAWSPREARDGEDFRRRLKIYRSRLDKLNVYYYPVPELGTE